MEMSGRSVTKRVPPRAAVEYACATAVSKALYDRLLLGNDTVSQVEVRGLQCELCSLRG